MSLLGASRFWITTTLIVAVGVCLSPGPARAQEPYDYYDDFNEDFAETTSFRHSIFWRGQSTLGLGCCGRFRRRSLICTIRALLKMSEN